MTFENVIWAAIIIGVIDFIWGHKRAYFYLFVIIFSMLLAKLSFLLDKIIDRFM